MGRPTPVRLNGGDGRIGGRGSQCGADAASSARCSSAGYNNGVVLGVDNNLKEKHDQLLDVAIVDVTMSGDDGQDMGVSLREDVIPKLPEAFPPKDSLSMASGNITVINTGSI